MLNNSLQVSRKSSNSSLLTIMFLNALILTVLISYLIIIKNEALGIIIGLSLLIVLTMLIKWNGDLRYILFGITVFVFVKFYSFFYLLPITGPDSTKYFGQTIQYDTFSSFLKTVIFEIQYYGIFNIQPFTLFGIFYMPFYYILNLSMPQSIILFNTIFTILIIYFWNKICSSYFSEVLTPSQNKIFLSSLTLFIFVSPVMSYWSSVFLKDIFSLFLGVASFYFFTKKKYILAIIFIVIATEVRSYTIAYLVCFWLINTIRVKTSIIFAFGASLLVIYSAGITGLINTFPMTLIILFTPNPSDLENWSKLFFPTFEGVLILLGLVLSLINYLTNKNSRKLYQTFVFSLVIYSCTLTLVGHTILLNQDMQYGFLSTGDDMFRKKLPFMLVIYTVIAYTLATLKIRLKLK